MSRHMCLSVELSSSIGYKFGQLKDAAAFLIRELLKLPCSMTFTLGMHICLLSQRHELHDASTLMKAPIIGF